MISPASAQRKALDLYWIPLGAGATIVRTSGKIYEAIVATLNRRTRADLYHSALVVEGGQDRIFIEMAPVFDTRGHAERGVVAQGSVGDKRLGRFRIFRYEVRRWPDGDIPDLAHSRSVVRVSEDPAKITTLLTLLPQVPAPVWGRDELHTGEMWNSNSVISWALTRANIDTTMLHPPPNGRAPGWHAGIVAATRPTPH